MNLHAFSTWIAMISQLAASQPGERIDTEPTVTADPRSRTNDEPSVTSDPGPRRFVPVSGNPFLDYDRERRALLMRPLP